jgi:hypothetical protein
MQWLAAGFLNHHFVDILTVSKPSDNNPVRNISLKKAILCFLSGLTDEIIALKLLKIDR